MYETMLAPINKMVKSNASKLVDDIIFDNKSFRAIGDGYLEKTKLAFKALTKPKVYSKYGFDYLKANFAEGIQENLQEAISKGASEQAMAIFRDPTRADYEGYMGHFMKGLGEQFSAQGAETFAGGFFMGMFAQPVMSAPAWGISKGLDLTINKERAKAAKEERDRLLKQDVDTLNELYKNDINFLAPDLQSAITGNGLSNDLHSAALKGNEMNARNAKEAATFHHVHTALRTGKFDIFLNKLKEYKGFTPKEAKEAFQDYGIEDGNKALKHIDKIIARSETIRNNYENVANEYPNPFRPNSHKTGTPLHQAHLTSYNAWEEAKKNLIFAKTSMQTHSERVEQMTQAFSKFGVEVAESDAQTFMSLLDPSKTIDEINTLKKEIAVLDPKNPEQQPLIAEKKQILKLLNDFYDSVSANKFALDERSLERTDKRAKDKFAKLVQYLGKKNKSFVYDTSIEQGYQLIKDNMQLKDEMQGLTNSINVLSNPTGFLSMQKRLEEVYSKVIKEKADILQFNKRQFITRKEINTTLNELQERHGLGITPEFAQLLKESIASDTPVPIPTSFIDLQTELPVDESDTRFKEALELWQNRIEFIENKKEEVPGEKKEETKSTEVTPSESKTLAFDKEDYSTYPEDLKKLIEEDFNKRKEIDDSVAEETAEEYALNNIFVQKIIKNYFKEKKDVEEGVTPVNEYIKLSKEEIEAKIKEFDDKVLTKEENDILNKLEDALAYKATLGKLTEKQKATLDKIEFLSSKTRKKNDDQSGYNINGTTYNLRVTKLVDRILEKDFGLKQFSFSKRDEGKFMISNYEELKKNKDLETKDKKKYADTLVDELFKKLNVPYFKKTLDRFNDRKIQAIKEGLKDDTSVENFIKLIEKYVYEESSIRGNTADDIVRAYFNNETVTKPDGMDQTAFDNLLNILKDIKKGIEEREEVIISKSLILSGEYNVEGKDEKVAGEMDLLVIDKEGKFKIYDLKTADNWNNFGTELDNTGNGFRKKHRYTLQLSLYKKLLEDSTGIKVKELELIPIETKEDKNGNITELNSAFDTKNTNIEYNPIVEKYLQPLGTKNEVPIEVEKKETKTPKGKIEAKDLIGKTYTTENDDDGKGVIKVLNITPGNEVKFETTLEETGESYEAILSFKDFQSAINSGIFKEIKVEVEEEEEEPTFIPEKDKVIPKKVKGASGWKLRFNINATTDKDYKSKAEKLSKWLDSYFGTSKRQEQRGDGFFAFKEGDKSSVWKHLAGGDKGESDFTIYIGSKEDAIKFAKQVEESEIKDLITIGTMGEDILIGNIVKGRFDSKEFKYLVPNVNILKKSLEEEGLSKNGEFVTETKSGIKISIIDGVIIYSTDGGKTFKDYKSGIMSDTKNVLEIRNQIIEDIYGDDYTGKGKPEEGPTPLSADEFNALSVSDKFNTLINTIDDEVVEGVLEPVTLPPGKVRPGKEWGYQLRLADGKTLRITYATRIQGVENIPEGETFTINKEKYTYEKDGQVITEDILAVKKDGKLVSKIVKNFDIFAEKPKGEAPIEGETITLEQLNKDINKESLKIAKEKGYEVEYNSLDNPDKSGNYVISKITKNFVSLTNPSMGEIKVPVNTISSTIKAIVEPGKKNFSQEDQDKLKENKAVVNNSDVSFNDKLTEDQTSSNLKDNIC